MAKSALKIAKFEELPAETKAIVEPVLRCLDEFYADLEKKANSEDVVDKESLKKALVDIEAIKTKANDDIKGLEERVNQAVAAMNRAGKGDAGDELKAKQLELHGAERKALDVFIRKGKHEGHRAVGALEAKAKELGFEIKDLSTVILEDGGVAVRPEWEASMIEMVEEISDLRGICRVLESGTADKKILVDKGGALAAWTTELEERTKTATAQLAERTFSANELYALCFMTETMKEDAVFDVQEWLMRHATRAIARAEGAAYINGDGVSKPKGILQQTIVADSSWSWGKLGYIATGHTPTVSGNQFAPSFPGASPATAAQNGADVLFRTIHSLPKLYRANCDWVMNRLTLAETRMLKDGDGQYLFKDALTANGFLSMLLGYPIAEAEDMPDIATNSFSIAFGDFSEGYYIVDRTGISVKRDDLTQPQFDKVYVRRRTTGDVADYQAIKLIKFAPS